MNIPATLRYTKSHEWVEALPEGIISVGLTDYAQHELGDIVFVNLPQIGDPVAAGERFADVESVKAVSDVYSPISGVVQAINEALLTDPAAINADPYGAWLIRVSGVALPADLLDAAAYQAEIGED
ncbi:MAG: glycine cleavage system protein GcvH [Oscillospiraceae bacterium]|jgi:glycine cleavage system H protein|nr:glycine cleavage system protein GcvH [Oscillospiraceae bacterium]